MPYVLAGLPLYIGCEAVVGITVAEYYTLGEVKLIHIKVTVNFQI